ncbi:histidinol-phosphate transaminase [Novosphingobium mangrovi (ex Hu et al. 2023)]|uniref:Histidinol-phosphate aminotransferase n=1 Tax=Novosphingobium mangrovi (ex Hu et al. 2023) TaxID=2930094 RepID=A0ABT0ABD3_9SPHN|nr:histidinol-phosphate transaminase [Novosphingobium mangrovi (ex Hu et al. 2023)]MCJ1960501.1 histidinol-phosphate transaminase [Novosphingobium mangrovi (ex Hu et al. 2023)]
MSETTTSKPAPAPKPWIKAIHAYVPGKSAGADGKPLIKLSANENPLGTSEAALAARQETVPPSLYPDPDSRALREAIAARHGLEAARVVMGTGSDEILNLAAQGYAGPGDEVIYVRYGFAVYDIAARRCGAVPVVAPDADYGTDVDALLGRVTEKTRVVFLANPNNPTGSYLPKGEIARLHAALPSDVLLVIDQAYGEYVPAEDEDGAFALAATHENVLVTRTFSKIFGLAGERVGWGTGAPAIIDTLNRIRGPFNVSVTAQASALAALGDTAFIERSFTHNLEERARFVGKLEALGNHGLRPLPSQANFVLVLFEGSLSAEAAYNGLAERGYIVRWLPGQGLPQALRFTIGKRVDMDAMADALAEMAEAAG